MPTKPAGDEDESGYIRRTFILTNDNHPTDPPRKIVQIQCVTWPDFDVPTSPDVLLGLIKDVGDARVETREGEKEDSPVLIHCSAGIGRTGSFILVDSVLDGLNRSREKRKVETREVNSMPTPGRHNSATHSRRGSGSPQISEGGQVKGHTGRVKSVSFLHGDRPVLGDGTKVKKNTVSSPLAPTKATSAPIKLSSQPQSQGLDWIPRDAQIPDQPTVNEGMEIDSPFEYSGGQVQESTSSAAVQNNAAVDQWLQYRSEADGEETGRRPSINSVYTSDEKLSSEQ